MPVHRTAIFTLHNPTRHVRAILDHALACYTEAYSTALHVYADYSPHILIQMATCNMGTDRQPITRARWLEQTLFAETVPAALAAALRPLHSSQRESVRLHVARTLLSYATLALRLPSTSVVNDGVPDQVQ